ncbi:MAG: hypothetical protein HY866_17745, partial [Chloroflexi bacterium]|nr:hypothetical protein [Chloroflexota bacterium]
QPDLSAMLGDDIPAYADRAAAPAANFPTHTETYEDQPLEIDSTPLMEEEMPTGDRQDPPDSVELLRVWRDLSDGSLIVEIGGRQFRSLNDLRSADLERRFLNVLRDLTTLSTSSAAAASAAPARPRPAAPTAVPPAAPSPESKTPKDKMPDQDAENGPVSLSPGSMFRQMRRVAMGQGPAPVERKPEQTIAEQIENILQARLVDLPEFRKRSIHVSPALSGGVRIEVDGQFYDGVGDVEDQAVRDLLIEVVRVWEQSQ